MGFKPRLERRNRIARSRVQLDPVEVQYTKHFTYHFIFIPHCNATAEAMGSNSVEAPKTFLGLNYDCLNRNHNCDNHTFISFVCPQFRSYSYISYITSHSFLTSSLELTHAWPAPNVSDFIAQLVRPSHWYRMATGSNLVEVLTFSGFYRNWLNCVHNCEDDSWLQFSNVIKRTDNHTIYSQAVNHPITILAL